MPAPAARFSSNLIALACGALLVVAAFAFRTDHLVWIAFALGTATAVTELVSFAFAGRGAVTRILDVCLGVVSGWTILASLLYTAPHLVRWLSVGEGAALAGLGFTGLLVHEFFVERELRAARRHALLVSIGRVDGERGYPPEGAGRIAHIRESLP